MDGRDGLSGRNRPSTLGRRRPALRSSRLAPSPAAAYLRPTVARPIAVLFDLDGTLVDTVPFILSCVRHTFEGEPRGPTDAEWIAGIGTPLRVQLAQFAASPERVEPLFQRYRAIWLEHHDAMTRLFPGAGETVRALRAAGHPIGVVTAKIEVGRRADARVTSGCGSRWT